MNVYFMLFAVSIAVNAIFFAFAATRKTDVLTDLSYSLSFVAVAAALVIFRGAAGLVALLPAILAFPWAFRLGGYLFTRIVRVKVDHRFDGMREDPLKFARFWALQAIAVGVIMLPAAASADSGAVRVFGPIEAVGIALWGIGFALEAVADAQKSAFKRSGRLGFMRTGVWAWSRHPNYFGEALLWWGAFACAVPALAGWAWLSVLGPVFITALLLFVSGVPLLEKAADAKYGSDADYVSYKKRTSVFVPLPPRRV